MEHPLRGEFVYPNILSKAFLQATYTIASASLQETQVQKWRSASMLHLLPKALWFQNKMLAMSRITITLDDAQHRSLKLLSILENKTLAQVLHEAINSHLESKGAQRLEVTQSPLNQEEN